jgi:hypothetical protein
MVFVSVVVVGVIIALMGGFVKVGEEGVVKC